MFRLVSGPKKHATIGIPMRGIPIFLLCSHMKAKVYFGVVDSQLGIGYNNYLQRLSMKVNLNLNRFKKQI